MDVHLSLRNFHHISGRCAPKTSFCRRPPACAASSAASISTRPGRSTRRVITHGHSDHARAGHGAVLATQETLDIMRLRYGENFAGSTQAIGYGESVDARRRQGDLPSGRPCARLGADRGRGGRPAHRRLRRLQGRRRSDLRAVRAGALRRVHHRGDVRPAGVPPRRRRRRDRQAAAFGRAVSRARASRRRLLARQGAARDRAASARPATTSRSICMARWRRSRAITRAAASISAASSSARGASKAELAGTITLCPPSALKDRWSRRFPDPVTCFASGWMRVRARARQRRRRAAAGHLRPRRLGRAHRHHRRDRRRAKSGSRTARRTRWCTGA